MADVTERLDRVSGELREFPAIDRFIEDIITVSMKHGMSIGVENWQHILVIEPIDDRNFSRLRNAHANIPEGELWR